MRPIDKLKGAHDRSEASLNTAQKRVSIHLMLSAIVNVRTGAEACVFLFVIQVVLRVSLHAGRLKAKNGFVCCFATKKWIRTKSLRLVDARR